MSRRLLPVKVPGQNLSVPRHPQRHAGILQTQMGEQREATFSHYSDEHMPSSSHHLTNTSREILTTEPPRTAMVTLILAIAHTNPSQLLLNMRRSHTHLTHRKTFLMHIGMKMQYVIHLRHRVAKSVETFSRTF